MRLDQFFQKRAHSDNEPEINIIEWITLDESDQMTDEENHDDCMRFIQGEPIPGILEFADPVCVRKNISESASIDFLLEDEEVPFPECRFLQIQHPNTWEWHLIDRDKGRINESQNKPYKEVPVIYAE